ncbi:MAG: hypothetical protein ABW148_11630 [Sedimenticola sp.]
MATPTILEYLKYADLQVASEAFIRNPDTGDLRTSGQDYIDALTDGNKHASRFTKAQAKNFASQWEVLDQEANIGTGFSGTLFRHRMTKEHVISFRSTEFIDDAVRDSLATNQMEIFDTGFAWGQISDMEALKKGTHLFF